jgi:glycerol-3-phosphate dehydrogenase subunit C
MNRAERLIRNIVEECADCDCCRDLMDTNCLFFPRLYQLWDREQETGEKITSEELRSLADLCNYCALCPCEYVRRDVITAKTLFIDRDGLDLSLRILEDVDLVGRLCGAIPKLSNFLIQGKATGNLVRNIAGIHPKRKIPPIPEENFSTWAGKQRLHEKPEETGTRKVAYFSGCTARHLFPNVARATVEVLQQNGITVYYPEQECCGMPSMLEGDRKRTLAFADRTLSLLEKLADEGYDIVTSCPTCGYMLKKGILDRAYYSETYQEYIGGTDRLLKIPEHVFLPPRQEDGGASTVSEGSTHMGRERMIILDERTRSMKQIPTCTLNKSLYGKILKDDGYFSSLDPMKRIRVAEHVHDLGQYLLALHETGELSPDLGPVPGKTVYYPPCHQREQEIGTPYLRLLSLIPDISMDAVKNTFYCCGAGGIMGFKRDFHTPSLKMGSPLIARIRHMTPDRLTTDCLSCRMQFNQMCSYPVLHPIEILRDSYQNRH